MNLNQTEKGISGPAGQKFPLGRKNTTGTGNSRKKNSGENLTGAIEGPWEPRKRNIFGLPENHEVKRTREGKIRNKHAVPQSSINKPDRQTRMNRRQVGLFY